MTWLHVARTDLGWLVIPGIHDALFAWAIARACPALRYLPTARGWLVPHDAEAGLWSAVAASHGPHVVCPACLHGTLPCDGWVNLLARRFEAARAEQAPPRVEHHHARQRSSRARREPPKVSREDRLRTAAKTLGIAWPADRAAVTRAFRAAIMKAHPDLGGSDQKAAEVVAARNVLLSA